MPAGPGAIAACRIRPARLLVGIVLVAGWASAVSAQAPSPAPICGPPREGMVACFGERLCECRFDPGGSLASRSGGFRWDCGIMRPSCGIAYPTDPMSPAVPLRELPPLLYTPRDPSPTAPRFTPP